MLVSRGGVTGTTDKALIAQLGGYPRALAVSSFLLLSLSLLPGIPMIPFLILAAGTGYAAFYLNRQQRQAKLVAQQQIVEEQKEAIPAEEPISTALAIDDLRLELGYGLLTLINDNEGYRLTDQIKALRRQIAGDMGFVMPSVRILDNMQLPANNYVVRVKELEAGEGDVRPNQLLVMDPQGLPIDLPGEETTEPTFGLPAVWVDEGQREEASFRGYTVVDPATVVTTHLTEILKDHMADLLSYAETQKLLDELPAAHQKLVADVIPNQITVSGIQRVLQNLLTERISIRDLASILEGISEATGYTHNISMITEHVRARLARQISATNTAPDGFIPLVTLSPQWEQNFADAIIGQGEEKQLSMAPSFYRSSYHSFGTILTDWHNKDIIRYF
nr:FHIPEP family type III secretion protein [Sneathiella glossodoripedis]